MSSVKHHPVRAAAKLIALGSVLAWVALDFIVGLWLVGKSASTAARTAWLQRSSRRLLRSVRVTARYRGPPPQRGILIANHLSYLDVLVLGQAQPLLFVAKNDVRNWPFLGWLTACAGTLYIQRESKTDVLRLAEQFGPLIEQGNIIVIFPEGTSSDGLQVLPFRSALLEPAAANGWPVTPAWIGYRLEDGSVAAEVAYWGDMTFGPHLLNLLSKKRIEAFVAYGPAVAQGLDRKTMARELHAQVCQLAARRQTANRIA